MLLRSNIMMALYYVLLILLGQNIVQHSAKCLNNYAYKDSSNEWYENQIWKTNGYISPNITGKLKDWQLQITFTAPLVEDIKAYVFTGMSGTAGKKSIILNPAYYITEISKDRTFSYIVAFEKSQGDNHLGVCAVLWNISRFERGDMSSCYASACYHWKRHNRHCKCFM